MLCCRMCVCGNRGVYSVLGCVLVEIGELGVLCTSNTIR